MSTSQHRFGVHDASTVRQRAATLLTHIEDPAIWTPMSDPHRGRMTHADVEKGRALAKAAIAAASSQSTASGATVDVAYVLDHADEAAHAWLVDQLTHARGVFTETGDASSAEALDKILSHRKGHADIERDIRAYADAARADNALGHALSSSYLDAAHRDELLADGVHLADALHVAMTEPSAAIGARIEATGAKDETVAQLSRWLRRWTLVAQRALTADGRHTLGLADHRRHPSNHGKRRPPVPPPVATTAQALSRGRRGHRDRP